MQRLVEVHRGGGGKAIGALAQVDLVHVELEQGVLVVVRLELAGQQDLHDLAAVGLLWTEKEHAGHLHGDGAAALRAPAGEQVAPGGARQAGDVHAAVRVEARVLDGQQRLAHALGDLLDRHELAAFLTVLGQQAAVPGVDAQRQLGLVVGQRLHAGQFLPQAVKRVGAAQREAGEQAQDEGEDKARRRAPGRGVVRNGRRHQDSNRWSQAFASHRREPAAPLPLSLNLRVSAADAACPFGGPCDGHSPVGEMGDCGPGA